MYPLKEENAEHRNFVGDVLACVEIGLENEERDKKQEIVIFKGIVEGLYWQMFDEYEFGRLETSEYDFDESKIEPSCNWGFKIIDCKGKTKQNENKNLIIKKVIKVFDENMEMI